MEFVILMQSKNCSRGNLDAVVSAAATSVAELLDWATQTLLVGSFLDQSLQGLVSLPLRNT